MFQVVLIFNNNLLNIADIIIRFTMVFEESRSPSFKLPGSRFLPCQLPESGSPTFKLPGSRFLTLKLPESGSPTFKLPGSRFLTFKLPKSGSPFQLPESGSPPFKLPESGSPTFKLPGSGNAKTCRARWKSVTEAEFKEFEPRLKFKPRLKYGRFYLKLYQTFQDLSRRSIKTSFRQI